MLVSIMRVEVEVAVLVQPSKLIWRDDKYIFETFYLFLSFRLSNLMSKTSKFVLDGVKNLVLKTNVREINLFLIE